VRRVAVEVKRLGVAQQRFLLAYALHVPSFFALNFVIMTILVIFVVVRGVKPVVHHPLELLSGKRVANANKSPVKPKDDGTRENFAWKCCSKERILVVACDIVSSHETINKYRHDRRDSRW